jgi:hypothetical protein
MQMPANDSGYAKRIHQSFLCERDSMCAMSAPLTTAVVLLVAGKAGAGAFAEMLRMNRQNLVAGDRMNFDPWRRGRLSCASLSRATSPA